jgi:hypothetical protein
VATCRRWRTIPFGKISNGIRMFWQVQQSLLVDLLPLTAINVAIPPLRQRSDSTSPAAIQIQIAGVSFSTT